MDYRVKLEIYKGPLDLLLYLIQESEVDIYDIPIATITEQYLGYIELLKMVDPNIAGDFLVMASTLLEIKSRMLLPRPERDQDEEYEGDPRIELIRQLMEYKKYKEAAGMLSERHQEQLDRFGRASRQVFEDAEADEDVLEVSEVSIWDILSAFDRVMRETLRFAPATITDQDIPLRQHVENLVRMLRDRTALTFLEVFEVCEDRIEAIGALLAVLEMARAQVIGLQQSTPSAEIRITLANENNIPKMLAYLLDEARGDKTSALAAAEAETVDEPQTDESAVDTDDAEIEETEPAVADAGAADAENFEEDFTADDDDDEDLAAIRAIDVLDPVIVDDSVPDVPDDVEPEAEETPTLDAQQTEPKAEEVPTLDAQKTEPEAEDTPTLDAQQTETEAEGVPTLDAQQTEPEAEGVPTLDAQQAEPEADADEMGTPEEEEQT